MNMKKLTGLLAALALTIMPALQSCDNNDGYSIGDFTPPLWATTHVVGNNAFYLDCDVWGTLWPVNTDLGWFKPVEGERVITSFNPLSDNFQGYDHAVKLYNIQRVLTKQVEILTDENDDEYGNDPMTIFKGDLGISGNHLNLIFLQNLPSKEKHRISLVRPEDNADFIDQEGYLHLELRYNNYDDTTPRQAFGAVSYSLESIETELETAKGIKLKLQSEKNGEVTVTFNKESNDDEAGDAGAKSRANLDVSQMMLQ